MNKSKSQSEMNLKNECIQCSPSSSVLSVKRWVPNICDFSHLFLCILLSFPTLLLYLSHSCPDWIISLCSSICIIIKLVIFFSNFFIFKFYSQRQIWLFCSKIIYFWGASVWKHSIVRSFPYLIIPVPHC